MNFGWDSLKILYSFHILNKLHLQNPDIADVYTQHAKDTTVAAYAPSGFYIASGGKISPETHCAKFFQGFPFCT